MLGHGAISQFAISEWTTVVTVPETVTVDKWFHPLSEPTRYARGVLPGTRPSLQQFYFAPLRLLPNPSVFLTLSAIESGDTAGVTLIVSLPVGVAKVSIIEIKPTQSPVGLFEIKK